MCANIIYANLDPVCSIEAQDICILEWDWPITVEEFWWQKHGSSGHNIDVASSNIQSEDYLGQRWLLEGN